MNSNSSLQAYRLQDVDEEGVSIQEGGTLLLIIGNLVKERARFGPSTHTNRTGFELDAQSGNLIVAKPELIGGRDMLSFFINGEYFASVNFEEAMKLLRKAFNKQLV